MKQKSLGEQDVIRRLAGRYGLAGACLLFLFGLLAWAVLPFVASAVTPISQGYASDDKMVQGTLVSLKDNSSDTVVPANVGNVNNLLGAVINDNSSLLSVSSNIKNQTLVATTGSASVLVSDINGTIKRGDQVTASPINGVGMKATANVRVLGTAQSDFGNGTKQTYKDKGGQEKSVNISEIPVQINVAYFYKEPEKTVIPSAIQNVANALAGKSVSTVPILISGAIFVVTLVVVMSIIYSMIRSSIISIGRNPMSQSAVYRNVIQLSSIVIVILGVAFASIYMVLKKL
jgi:hypothetical protein